MISSLAGRLGRLLAPDLVRVGLELGLLDLLLLELERVAHLLGRELLGEQRLEPVLVLVGQIDVPDEHVAQHDAVGRAASA